MKDNFFADSNVLLYLLGKEDSKKSKAQEILFRNPVISTQVVSENINVSFKKLHLPKKNIALHIQNILQKCEVKTISTQTIQTAYEFFNTYQYSYYDCLIIASAFENECAILYSEDMQHNHVIEGKVQIINPFLK